MNMLVRIDGGMGFMRLPKGGLDFEWKGPKPPTKSQQIRNKRIIERIVFLRNAGYLLKKDGTLSKTEGKLLTVGGISRAAGLSQGYLGSLLTGQQKNATTAALESIARVMLTDIASLTSLQENPTTGEPLEAIPEAGNIPIIGIVEAGAFRKMSDAATLDAPIHGYATGKKHDRFRNARHFAFIVRDDSMNVLRPTPIPRGQTVFCVDLSDTGQPIESGGTYVIRRTIFAAAKIYEFLIRRADVSHERIELAPVSTNPIYEKFVLAHQDVGDPDAEVMVLGRVYHVGSDVP